MFKIVKEMPISGTFIVVWENGTMWSEIFEYGEGGLFRYDAGWDDWHPVHSVNDGYPDPRELSFIVKEETNEEVA